MITSLPKNNLLVYEMNSDSGNYQVSAAPLGFKKMPQIFKVEPTQKRDKIKTETLTRGRHGKWDDVILTGLMPFRKNWYFGDHYEKGKKSLIVFHFTPDKRRCTALYHNGYYPHNPTIREEVVNLIADQFPDL